MQRYWEKQYLDKKLTRIFTQNWNRNTLIIQKGINKYKEYLKWKNNKEDYTKS